MQTKAKPIEGIEGMANMLTTAQVADLRGVKPSAVYRAINRGILSAGAIHGRLFVQRQDAERWQPLTDSAERARKAGETRWAKAKNSPTPAQPTPTPTPTPAADQSGTAADGSEGEQ